MHKCTNTVNDVQPIRNSSPMAKILSVYNRLQAVDYENGNGSKRRVSRLAQFIHTTLQFSSQIDFTKKPTVGCKRSNFVVAYRYIEVFKSSLEELMTAVMKIQRQQVQPLQSAVGYGGRGRSYGQMDRYGMGMGPMGIGAPCDAMGFGGGRGGGRMGNMGRGKRISSVMLEIRAGGGDFNQ